MKKPLSVRHLLAIIILIIMISIGYRMDLHSQQTRYLNARTTSLQLQHQIKQYQQQTQQSTQDQTSLNQTKTSFSDAITILPKAQNFNDYLQGIIKQGQSDQLTFAVVNPQPAQTKDFYHVVPVQLTIIGTYQNLIDFMQQTAAPNTLINWGDWTITRETPAATTLAENNTDLLTLQATANFYYYP